MLVRRPTNKDLEAILKIYENARNFMKQSGNPTQWKDTYPYVDIVEDDIKYQRSYVIEENGVVLGVFALIEGIDPTYLRIDNGKWLNDEPYVTIHRIASIGKNCFEEAVKFSFTKADNIRIDTHKDNSPMRHKLEKNGFTYCGIIYTHDGTERLAFQKVKYDDNK